MYPGLNELQERKLCPACPSMVPLHRGPDDFCMEHKGEAASHSTHLWLCLGAQMGANRAGKYIYLPLGPIWWQLLWRSPASDRVGAAAQGWGGTVRCHQLALGRLLAALGSQGTTLGV